MRLAILSDTHFEFHMDQGATFIKEFQATAEQADVIVHAGDSSHFAGLENALRGLCSYGKPLVYVSGNHDFYGADRERVSRLRERLARELPNLHWLRDSTVTLQGQRFVGSTLWFRQTPYVILHPYSTNDGKAIRGFWSWLSSTEQAARAYLTKTLTPQDIAVTHYLPCAQAAHPKWQHSTINGFFQNDMSPVLAGGRPKIWVYGHTHDFRDTMLTEHTRGICNPFGYAHTTEVQDFHFKVWDL